MLAEEIYRQTKKSSLYNVLKVLDESKIKLSSFSILENTKISEPKDILGDSFPTWLKDVDTVWLPKNSRRKITLQIDSANNVGFFAPKSHQLQVINSFDLAEDAISDLISPLSKFIKTLETGSLSQAIITAFENGLDLFLVFKKKPNQKQLSRILEFAKIHNLNCSYRFENSSFLLLILRKNIVKVGSVMLEVESGVFLQATKAGLDAIISRLELQFQQSEFSAKKIVDFYAGFGTYCFALQGASGFSASKFFAFEGDEKMVEIAKRNVARLGLNGKINAFCRDIANQPLSAKELKEFDAAIINPPRIGAASQILAIAKSSLKYLHYVSCNPNSFAFDAKILLNSGFVLKDLVAIDQFHSTAHIELVACFSKL